MISTKPSLTILVTGVFDLLHIEHLRFLAAAKQLGTQLWVGVETDARVKQLKGANRPLNPSPIRIEQLQALRVVDRAFLLPDKFSTYPDWFEFMDTTRPDIYAVSAHSAHLDIKTQICRQLGIQLVVVRPHQPDYSTTKLLDKAGLIE